MRLQVDRSLTLSDLGLISKKRNDLAGAARSYEEVVRVRKRAFESDRGNTRHWFLLSSGLLYLASTYSALGRQEEAIAIAREAVSMNGVPCR